MVAIHAQQQRHSLDVAVVGGGAAGLAACHELLRAGHSVTVLEKGADVGGVWDYSDATEDDPLGLGQLQVHGSMYEQLRTNLPREVMGYAAFPFDAAFPGSADPRQFCSHQEVQRYLQAFAAEFDLLQHIRFGTEVLRVAPITPAAAAPHGSNSSSSSSGGGTAPVSPDWPRWEVTTRPSQPHAVDATTNSSGSPSSSSTEQYDAVVVCNGHYSRPRLPRIPGQQVFPGLQLHSHNYRRPDGFRGQTVVLLGASSSGVDIAAELLEAGAKRVYLCARVWENPLTGEVLDASSTTIPGSAMQPGSSNGGSSSGNGSGGGGAAPTQATAIASGIIKAANLQELHADGSVTLADGSCIAGVDVVMYCTGYVYDFPFLEASGVVAVQDNRVGPLYQHIFPPAVAPTLAFVGLTWKVVPFPQFELQSRWIARVLAGAAQLPSREEMEKHVEAFYAELAAAGTPQRYTHRQGADQWAYNAWLREQCGTDAHLPASWREQLYNATGRSRKLNGGGYRDAPLPGAEEAEEAARQEAALVRKQHQQQPRQQVQEPVAVPAA